MKIAKQRTVSEIMSEFNSLYPHLKIEFYMRQHDVGEGSKRRDQIAHSVTLGEVNPALKEGTISLAPQITVAELEKNFSKKFGLNIQVFRRSGMLWLQTSSTDDWTLDTQESKGGHSEEIYKG